MHLVFIISCIFLCSNILTVPLSRNSKKPSFFWRINDDKTILYRLHRSHSPFVHSPNNTRRASTHECLWIHWLDKRSIKMPKYWLGDQLAFPQKSDPPWCMALEPMEDGRMSKKRHKPEEIAAKLRQGEVLTARGPICCWHDPMRRSRGYVSLGLRLAPAVGWPA